MGSPIILCGSLSRLAGPLGRSMHEAGYRALGLPFAYVPFEVRELAGAIAGMRALGIRGFGVSHPFKQEVLPLLDALDPVAERIGAVNTIVNDDGRLVGYNTDWIGAVRALEEVRRIEGVRVLLLGAGGAARAIAFGLAQRAARTTIANRDGIKAERLAAEVGAEPKPWDETLRAADYDVVINATTVGQADCPDACAPPTSASAAALAEVAASPNAFPEPSALPPRRSPVPEASLGAGQIVMDIVYKPLRTLLLDNARQRGAVAVHGGRMLLYQAAAQFEAYTRRGAPLEAMNQALEAALKVAVAQG